MKRVSATKKTRYTEEQIASALRQPENDADGLIIEVLEEKVDVTRIVRFSGSDLSSR